MTTATAETIRGPLTIQQWRVENFMRIAILEVDARGRHIILSGPNGSGKTSALDSIWDTLGGKSAKDMPEPVHNGELRSVTTLDLGEITVQRIRTAKNTRLIVTARDGTQFKRPQELLDQLIDPNSLDPTLFLKSRPQDQVDEVLRTMGVVPPVDRVREITGELHVAKAGESAAAYLERLSADESGLYYHRRRDAHREVETKLGALSEQRALVASLEAAGDVETRPATEIVAAIQRLQQKAQERSAVHQQAVQATATAAATRERLKTRERELANKEADIAALEARLAVLRGERDELAKAVALGQRYFAEDDASAKAAKAAADALPDPQPEIDRLNKHLADIEATNERSLKRRHAEERLDALDKEAAAAKGVHHRLDTMLEELRELRRNLLNGADLGIAGLEIGQGELRLNGVSFRQASQAERIRTACAIAFRRNPKIKILRLDDAEHLDSAGRELLIQLADEAGWQCAMSVVADVGELQVEIVEATAS